MKKKKFIIKLQRTWNEIGVDWYVQWADTYPQSLHTPILNN